MENKETEYKKLMDIIGSYMSSENIDVINNYYNYALKIYDGMTIDILKKGFTIKEVPVVMTHNETGRNISGFIHRFKQFYHIILILIKKLFKN